jgi:anthranilate synthase component II
MKILIIDNYDSFTFNLYHLVEAIMPNDWTLEVRRNDAVKMEEVAQADKIIISPGPGLPADAGITCDIIRDMGPTKSILGVCLGHQAIAEVFGGSLLNMPEVMHGLQAQTFVTDVNENLFADCPQTFLSARYHSWVVNPVTLPDCLQITATDEKGNITAIAHKSMNIKGVQFHPESILTPQGRLILSNWLKA